MDSHPLRRHAIILRMARARAELRLPRPPFERAKK
jgi:hypothetical protein